MGWMHAGKGVAAAVGFNVFLQLCGAHNMRCPVTQDDQTTYDIPDLSHVVDTKTSKCTYTWSDASDTVIGTHSNKMEPVLSSSFGKLVTSECIGNVTFSATCELEGRAQDYMASCITTCTTEPQVEEGGIPPHWITAIVVAIFLVCLMGFLCYNYKIYRKCSCGQTGGFYTTAKYQKNDQGIVHVERGKE